MVNLRIIQKEMVKNNVKVLDTVLYHNNTSDYVGPMDIACCKYTKIQMLLPQ